MKRITDAWVVDRLDIPCNTLKRNELQKYSPLKHIQLPELHDSDVRLLIGADYPDLLFHHEFKLGNEGDPVAVQTYLG